MIDENFYHAPGAPLDLSEDYIVRATALKGHVRAFAIKTTNAVKKASEIHGTSPVVTAALGRFITGSLMLAENMKGENDSQTTTIKSDGPIKGMTCVCDSKGHARAYPIATDVPASYHRPGKLDVGAAVGKGMLTIIRDIGLREPYVGSVELVSGEIAEDFTYYLASSEQTPSVVSLGVQIDKDGVTHAGGMMIQLMPGATEEDIDYLEKRVNGGFPEITFLMGEGLSPEKIVDMFLGDPDICFLSGGKVGFECNCSAEKLSSGLATLSTKDLNELANDPAGIDVECHFCNTKYHFASDDVRKLISSK